MVSEKEKSDSKKIGLTVVMPNYNGLELLKISIPSIYAAFEHSGIDGEIIVMDNASVDESARYLKESWPEVKVVERTTNDPLMAVNEGIDIASTEFITFTNNDMAVNSDYLDFIFPHFERKEVFAVTSRVFEWNSETIQGQRRIMKFQRGWFWYLPDESCESADITIHATGGQSVFRRETLRELGKFDMLFRPMYHEDLDLTYRAYKRGLIAIYEPRSHVYHKGGETTKKTFSKLKWESVFQKNLLLFIWKNIHDRKLIMDHIAHLPLRFLQTIAKGEFGKALGYFKALGQLGECLAGRKLARAESSVEDRALFDLFR